MIRKILYVILLFSFLVSACRKESEHIIISGNILDTTTNVPIGDVELILSQTDVSGSTYNAGYKDIANCKSEGCGTYWLETVFAKAVSYRIRAIKSGYFDHETFIDGSKVLVDDIYEQAIFLQPQATLSIRVKNQTPHNQNDSIAWWYGSTPYNCDNCCTDYHFTKLGTLVDTTITCTTAGNRWSRIQYAYRKSNTNFYVVDSIYCPAQQTTLFEIIY